MVIVGQSREVQWLSGRMLEIEGSLVLDSWEALCCVFEQNALCAAFTGSSHRSEILLTG